MKKYETQRLNFAAFLIASGRSCYKGTRSLRGTRDVAFILSQAPTERDRNDFFSGAGQVSALKYAEVLNSLKGAIYEAMEKT